MPSIVNTDGDISFDATIEDYTITDSADNGIDYEVSLKLKQYKFYGTKVVTFKEEEFTGNTVAQENEERKISKSITNSSHTIRLGENLWSIAQRELGNGNRAQELYRLNADTLDAAAVSRGFISSQSGALVFAGTIIRIPER